MLPSFPERAPRPAAEIRAATRRDAPGRFELVGHSPLNNRGMNAALAVYGDYAYVGNRSDASQSANAGVMVVDVSDPSSPKVVGQIGPPDEGLPGESGRRFYNAIQVVGDDGTILGAYDKSHLVPFGEYFPHGLDGLLRRLGLRQFVHVPGGFEPSERRMPFPVRGLPPAAATICYEAIFPGEVLPGGLRPGLILNVTNDAWFGDTPGPRQHFAQARLRAVEEGLPLVRAANTGVSAVIDPYGRVLRALPLGVDGVLDSSLPRSIPPTTFARWGDRLFGALLVCCGAAALIARRSRRRVREGLAGASL